MQHHVILLPSGTANKELLISVALHTMFAAGGHKQRLLPLSCNFGPNTMTGGNFPRRALPRLLHFTSIKQLQRCVREFSGDRSRLLLVCNEHCISARADSGADVATTVLVRDDGVLKDHMLLPSCTQVTVWLFEPVSRDSLIAIASCGIVRRNVVVLPTPYDDATVVRFGAASLYGEPAAAAATTAAAENEEEGSSRSRSSSSSRRNNSSTTMA